MRESAIQVMFFMKDEIEEKKVNNFLKKYPGKILVSVPIERSLKK
jgi:hypothetical protein